MRFDAPTNPVTSPTQQNRDIYTCHWSAVKTTSDQLAGDLRSLLSLYLQAQYDSDPPVANENGAWASELYIGTRSASRAVGTFQPNINLIDLYNPSGVDVTVGAIYCTVSGGSGDTGGTPLGKYVAYSHAGAGPPYIFETLATISLGDFPAYSTAISDYTGQYHAYLRYNVPSGDDGDLLVRLSVGYSDPYTYLQTIPLDTLANMRMADLGIINIPADGGRSGYNQMKCDLILTIQNTSGAARTASFYDLILMPCDELFFVANRNTSQWVSYTGVCVLDGTGGYKHSPVLGIMTYAGTIGVNPSVDVFSGGWLYRGVAPLSLQSNADQEIWFLSAMDLGVHPEITFPDFAPLISVSANTVAQYESMRGAS